MTRRFVYDEATDTVVEVEVKDRRTLSPAERYDQMLAGYRESTSERSGNALRAASLERADRREFAHRRYSDEKRWIST